ncbi:MAG: pantoate--beta-alanine ligase [Acidobacteriia bacterium]|nr:pantoate--beta-alanine ligase [Terriglobia bacterium]
MDTITSSKAMTTLSQAARRADRRLGFVPTMGALHEGHLSLVRLARAQCDVVVVSIFVNPAQFGPNEDFSRYPRTLEKDSAMLAGEGTDYVFFPAVEEIYAADATTWVTVEGLTDKLDGGSRPGHFRGVSTVVAKLFNIVQPDLAFFGQKDGAQVSVVCRMVRDLHFDVGIVVGPIVREADGLAMSSRNVYLDPTQRKQALVLHRSLQQVKILAAGGERNAAKLIAAGREEMAREPGARLDYFEIVNWETLDPVADVRKGALVAVAAYVGTTRLIDNIVLEGQN